MQAAGNCFFGACLRIRMSEYPKYLYLTFSEAADKTAVASRASRIFPSRPIRRLLLPSRRTFPRVNVFRGGGRLWSTPQMQSEAPRGSPAAPSPRGSYETGNTNRGSACPQGRSGSQSPEEGSASPNYIRVAVLHLAHMHSCTKSTFREVLWLQAISISCDPILEGIFRPEMEMRVACSRRLTYR